MSKIVIINQSSGYLMRDICHALKEQYEDVVIIASWPVDGVMTDRIAAYDKRSSSRRIWTWMLATIQIWWKLVVKYRDYELFIVSNPPTSSLLPLIVKNPFSFLIFDIYPDVLVSQGTMSGRNYLVRRWREANEKVYAKAKWVFTISEGMKKCLCQYVDAEKIKVVPLWPNNAQIHKIEKCDNQFVKEHHLEDKFIVLYSGNLGSTHRMDVLVDVAKRVEDATFLIIGEGAKKRDIENRIEKEQCKNVMLLPRQPYELLSHSLSAADIAVVSLDMNASQMSVPSKAFNLMAVGAPIMGIASPDSELGKMIDKFEMGRTFSPDDIEEMAAFVREMKNNSILKNRLSHNALSASRYFTSDNARLFTVKD